MNYNGMIVTIGKGSEIQTTNPKNKKYVSKRKRNIKVIEMDDCNIIWNIGKHKYKTNVSNISFDNIVKCDKVVSGECKERCYHSIPHFHDKRTCKIICDIFNNATCIKTYEPVEEWGEY